MLAPQQLCVPTRRPLSKTAVVRGQEGMHEIRADLESRPALRPVDEGLATQLSKSQQLGTQLEAATAGVQEITPSVRIRVNPDGTRAVLVMPGSDKQLERYEAAMKEAATSVEGAPPRLTASAASALVAGSMAPTFETAKVAYEGVLEGEALPLEDGEAGMPALEDGQPVGEKLTLPAIKN